MDREPPMSLRLGPREPLVEAWAAERGLKKHAAVLALVDLGLETDKPSAKTVLEAAQRHVGLEPVKLVVSAPVRSQATSSASAPQKERVSMSKAMDDAVIQVGRTTYKPGALLKGPKTTKKRP